MGDPSGVIIERVVNGRYVRVTAIDPETGIEVVVVADAAAPPALADKVAVRKLMNRLKQKT